MLAKLSRADYYDEDYVLNEYEYKELNFSKVDPYWKVRALCYFFNLDIIGEKHTLIHRVEDTLFNSYLMKKNPEEALKETADLPLEYFLKNTKCPAKRSKGFSVKELEASIREELGDNQHALDPFVPWETPWQCIVEITKHNKRLSYAEVQKGIAALMRPTMCFYNHCLEGETITAVVAFPFTPNMVREMTEVQVFALSKILGLTYTEECGVAPAEVFRQKLYDMWYFVEDSSRMHAVVPCQSLLRKCSNLASGLSGNYMCKMCQLELQNREPSLIHDSHDQFFRHKIRSMYEFEESHGFDRKRTIRVTMRRMIKKHDLERMFKDYSVDFSKMEVLYSPQTHRMQYIYLQCTTPDEAKRIMQFKSMICAKLGREDIKLESLCNNLVKAHQKYRDPENVCVLVTPPSSMEVVEELPKGDDLVTQITNVVQMVTQLEPHQIILETDINTITGEKDFRHVFVTLPNRQFVERLYEAQPFFGCLICHKLVHPQITPFLRFASDVCLMCSNLRDLNNPMDMCLDCAAKQKTLHISCPSVAPKIQELQLKRKEFAKERGVPLDSLCEKSPNLKLKGDPNNLSKSAYLIQANYTKEPRHERSCYWEQLKDLKPVEMARHMVSQVAEMHIKLRNELRNGRYDWFKPIYGSNIEEYMIKANKELQEVVDNGNLMRGHTTKKMLKEGKIFTFQANLPIGFNINPRVNI